MIIKYDNVENTFEKITHPNLNFRGYKTMKVLHYLYSFGSSPLNVYRYGHIPWNTAEGPPAGVRLATSEYDRFNYPLANYRNQAIFVTGGTGPCGAQSVMVFSLNTNTF